MRWYGALFASGFVLGTELFRKVLARESEKESYPIPVEPLVGAVGIGTIVGARLGHCLFYEPEVYLRDPLRILRIWEGGLASHGGGIGVILALLWFARKHKIPKLYLLDRMVFPTMVSGTLIRLGNLFNSEIVGRPTDVPWAFVFERVDQLPRHPAQLYESIGCAVLLAILLKLHSRPALRQRPGFLFGVMMSALFAFRFFVEFFKEHQVAFESQLPIDMGQLLSIPFVAVGIYFWVTSRKRKA